MSPIEFFDAWYKEELSLTQVRIPEACCLSTIGLDGVPNARFVSLKAVVENKFVITGSLKSRKGNEIDASNKVALTFWWPETERQVRIQGHASTISEKLADQYFADRKRDAQIISILSDQGQELYIEEDLENKYEDYKQKFSNQPLTRPNNWGGYMIDPIRIEFFEFNPSRFHIRTLYELNAGHWMIKQLQP